MTAAEHCQAAYASCNIPWDPALLALSDQALLRLAGYWHERSPAYSGEGMPFSQGTGGGRRVIRKPAGHADSDDQYNGKPDGHIFVEQMETMSLNQRR